MNVVFDIGNVLVHWEPRALYRKIFATEAEVEWFITNVCNPRLEPGAGPRPQLRRGGRARRRPAFPSTPRPSRPMTCAGTRRCWGRSTARWRSSRSCRRSGTPLYAITNFNQDKFRETLARFPFLGAPSATSSCPATSGCSSRTPRSTALLLERNGLEAASCVFIDDSEKNVRGAEAVGMKAIHFTTPEALRVELAGMGLL